MTDTEIEKIAQMVAEKTNSQRCSCGLSEPLMHQHEVHHLFLSGLLSTKKLAWHTTIGVSVSAAVMFVFAAIGYYFIEIIKR